MEATNAAWELPPLGSHVDECPGWRLLSRHKHTAGKRDIFGWLRPNQYLTATSWDCGLGTFTLLLNELILWGHRDGIHVTYEKNVNIEGRGYILLWLEYGSPICLRNSTQILKLGRLKSGYFGKWEGPESSALVSKLVYPWINKLLFSVMLNVVKRTGSRITQTSWHICERLSALS